jgi:hypothetical protein
MTRPKANPNKAEKNPTVPEPNKELPQVPVIQVNEAGRRLINKLCDIALKVEGVKNLQGVNLTLSCTKLIPSEKP